MVLPNDIDLLNPPAELEKRKHKLKRLVQSPNSFFMDVKCQGCFNITTVFSHSQTVVVCGNCQTVLCQPTGGRARLTEGCSFRRKGLGMHGVSAFIQLWGSSWLSPRNLGGIAAWGFGLNYDCLKKKS
ncbi:40S ribosomal protein S27-2 [Camellia lanceoleosa]|uniref:40S ribosomal protein S27-2 n=1 Tax=Camellia lanceoleosa TaxID=1840588 RepID=A0ACC0FUM7_9ERIC|nr:40S ribosomal protein S27-2 [Camellia lanceoleosa]